jgi:hypothetical protein
VCNLNLGGGAYAGTVVVLSGSLSSGNSAKVSCTPDTALLETSSGSQITGSISVSTGASVYFVAAAQ